MILRLLALFIVLLHLPHHSRAAAESPYTECYTASDFGNIYITTINVKPIGNTCDVRCETECAAFSSNSSSELNSDIIDTCRKACRSGLIFTSTIRQTSTASDATYGFKWSSSAISTTSACSPNAGATDSPEKIMYSSGFAMNPGETFRVTLTKPSFSDGNVVYMCGFETVQIYPVFESLKSDKWSSKQSTWINAIGNSMAQWHARNQNLVDTKIDLRDGDYISFTYGGQYRSIQNGKTSVQPIDLSLVIKNPETILKTIPYNGSDYPYGDGQVKFLPSSNIEALPSNPFTGEAVTDLDAVLANNSANSMWGLYPSAAVVRPTRFTEGLRFSDTDIWKSNGYTQVLASDVYYTYSGVLKGFSSTFTRFAIGYPFDYTDPSGSQYWKQRVGGNIVKIVRRGCKYEDGELLQYGFALQDLSSDAKNPVYLTPTEWFDLDKDTIEQFKEIDVNIATKGLLYFRIKPIEYDAITDTPTCSTSAPECIETISNTPGLFRAASRMGGYSILVEKIIKSPLSSGVISNLVDKIRGYLFGTNDNSAGVAQYVFNTLVGNSGIISAIRALLVLYIAYSGFSFMLGISQLNQKEGSIKLVKMGIVLMLLSPDSWEFFNTTAFKLITDGSLDVLVKIITPSDATEADLAALSQTPTLIFSSFDESFRVLFGTVTWLKISALLLSTPMGIVVCMMTIFAAVIYAICIAKATLLYLSSLIGIAILLSVSPVFLCFILFKYTKQMFDSWWKTLLSYALQPIFVLLAIFMLNNIALLCIKIGLGFAICSSCLLSFSFPLVGTTCIISGYNIVSAMHYPSSAASTFMPYLSNLLCLLIVCHAMYLFTTFGAKLAHMMAASMYAGALEGGEHSVSADFFNQSRGIAAKILQVDSEAIAGTSRLQASARNVMNRVRGRR